MENDKKMNAYTAVGLAEGFIEGSAQEQLEAWAYLIKTGMCWTLQGYFGRRAQDLIDRGVIDEAGNIFADI